MSYFLHMSADILKSEVNFKIPLDSATMICLKGRHIWQSEIVLCDSGGVY